MLTTRHHDKEQNRDKMIANKLAYFETVAKLRYLENTATNKNHIHGESNSKLNPGTFATIQFRILSSCIVSKRHKDQNNQTFNRVVLIGVELSTSPSGKNIHCGCLRTGF